ncbi:MAG: GNAT family N-acetyltransferase [Phycisphaeraceae bacterium]|nr:GNAT family N-acetyltransferase [Phycisphaeraceae bacterium]
MAGGVRIVHASDMDAMRSLLVEYARELGLSLCFRGFDEELASLPGRYAPPRGAMLVARDGEDDAGCVALHELDGATCEMKRLFVRPAWRGSGLGRELVLRVMDEARARGYERMRLDTLPVMNRAIRLYESMGFVDIPAYGACPVEGARWMERLLRW